MRIFETCQSEWLPANGPHVAYVAELATRGFVSHFSSGAAYHFSQKLGIRPPKRPVDLDLLVGGEDTFLEAFWLLARDRRKLVPEKYVELTSSDGARLSLTADEITGWPHASGEGPEIQIMRPLGPVRAEMPDGSVHYYDTTLDENLAAHNVRGGSLPYLHPKAGALLYRMYQRPHPKLDWHNAQVLERAAQLMPATSHNVHAIMEAKGFDHPRIHRAELAVAA